jgi:SOS-response transcriptional repressor LexA
LDEFTRKMGYAPTLRELSRAMGLKSLTGTVAKVDKLAARGLVKSDCGRARSLRLTAAGIALLAFPEMAVVDDSCYPRLVHGGQGCAKCQGREREEHTVQKVDYRAA